MFLLKANNLAVEIAGQKLFENVSIEIKQQERIALIGENGIGKTTLIKVLFGRLPAQSGHVQYGVNKKEIGYMVQENQRDNGTVMDFVIANHPNAVIKNELTHYSQLLAEQPEDLQVIEEYNKRLQKCRVAFVKLYFSNANLLVLDEPTNYFDIPTQETIENALIVYPGSIVLVAHDPYLLRKVANKVAYIKKGKVDYYPGSYHEWEQHQTFSNPVQLMMNKLEKLQLRYTQLITEENVDPAQEEIRLTEIKKIRVEIEEIKKKLIE